MCSYSIFYTLTFSGNIMKLVYDAYLVLTGQSRSWIGKHAGYANKLTTFFVLLYMEFEQDGQSFVILLPNQSSISSTEICSKLSLASHGSLIPQSCPTSLESCSKVRRQCRPISGMCSAKNLFYKIYKNKQIFHFVSYSVHLPKHFVCDDLSNY